MSFETCFQKQDIKYQDRHKAGWDKQRENKLQASPSVCTSAFTSLPLREEQQSQGTNNRETFRGGALLHHYNLTLLWLKRGNFSFQNQLQSPSNSSLHCRKHGSRSSSRSIPAFQLGRMQHTSSRPVTGSDVHGSEAVSHAVDDAALQKSAGHVWRRSAQQMMHNCLNFMCFLCWSQKCIEWWIKALCHAHVAYEAGCYCQQMSDLRLSLLISLKLLVLTHRKPEAESLFCLSCHHSNIGSQISDIPAPSALFTWNSWRMRSGGTTDPTHGQAEGWAKRRSFHVNRQMWEVTRQSIRPLVYILTLIYSLGRLE